MKGGLKVKWLSLTLTALICTTILFWSWERMPLVTILSPQSRLEMLSPVILNDTPTNHSTNLKQKVNVAEGSYVAEDEETRSGKGERSIEEHSSKMRSSQAENGFQLAPIGATSASFPKKRKVDNYLWTPSVEEKDSFSGRFPQKREVDGDLMTPPAEDRINVSTSLSDKRKVDNDLMTPPVEEKGCNYAKGKWVADKKWPLYSGFACKQWLSEMWACRLTQRTDFSYEGFRWQPEGCEMRAFDGATFLERMQDKTVALVGDSLGRQQFQSLMCMITGGKDNPEVENVGWKYGLVKAPGAIRPEGWAYWFPGTNTTVLYYWSASLCLLEPLNKTDPATNYAMHLDRPTAFLQRYIHMFDVLVLNTGHHWNRGKFQANHWVMYVDGEPLRDRNLALIGNAKNFTIYSIVKWLDSQLPQHPRLKAFFRTLSPRHFVNGDWNTGGSCDNTTPLVGGDTVSQDESSDPLAAGAVKGTRVKLLDITALSKLRDEGHMSHYSIKASVGVHDCLHWCLPGVPDTWNELLFAQL